jgi:hypothetical protein
LSLAGELGSAEDEPGEVDTVGALESGVLSLAEAGEDEEESPESTLETEVLCWSC